MPLPLTALLGDMGFELSLEGGNSVVFSPAHEEGKSVHVVSIVGAGGKTSLLFALARLLLQRNVKVVCTTTTNIFPPTHQEGGEIKVMGTLSLELFSANVYSALQQVSLLTMAGSNILETGKLGGVPRCLFPVLCRTLTLLSQNVWILVEADGAGRRPLKAPAGYEPVLPLETDWCIAIFGLDGLGKVFDEKNVHRCARACELSEQQPGSLITPETLVRLATHPESFFRACPPECRKVVLYNKADIAEDRLSIVLPVGRALSAVGLNLEGISWFAGSVREGWCLPLF